MLEWKQSNSIRTRYASRDEIPNIPYRSTKLIILFPQLFSTSKGDFSITQPTLVLQQLRWGLDISHYVSHPQVGFVYNLPGKTKMPLRSTFPKKSKVFWCPKLVLSQAGWTNTWPWSLPTSGRCGLWPLLPSLQSSYPCSWPAALE